MSLCMLQQAHHKFMVIKANTGPRCAPIIVIIIVIIIRNVRKWNSRFWKKMLYDSINWASLKHPYICTKCCLFVPSLPLRKLPESHPNIKYSDDHSYGFLYLLLENHGILQNKDIKSHNYTNNPIPSVGGQVYLTKEWSSWSGSNLAWNFACLQGLFSNDRTQNFSCQYAVQGQGKIAQSLNVQFKFKSPRMHVMAACLAVAWYSLVHSNGMHGTDADKAVKTWEISLSLMRACAHTHIYIHINCISMYVGTTHFVLGIKQSTCKMVQIWTQHSKFQQLFHALAQCISSWNFVYNHY